MHPYRTISIDTSNRVYSDRVMKKIRVRVKSDAFFNLIKNQIKYRDDQYPTK